MGAPVPGMKAADDTTAEALLESLKTISAAERRKHASVFNYWLSIRGDRQFPPIRDLDPLEISDAGPFSVLLEMIGGGEDATVRHLGKAIGAGVEAETVSAAPSPSLLTCIGSKLPIVASSREAFAFEDQFSGEDGITRCWVTLLPFSATGTWIDYVYGFVSLDPSPDSDAAAPAPETIVLEKAAEPEADIAEPELDSGELETDTAEPETDTAEPATEAFAEAEFAEEPEAAPAADMAPEVAGHEQVEAEEPPADSRPGFSAKFLDKLAGVGGFYGRVAEFQPTAATLSVSQPEPLEPEAAQVTEEPVKAPEGPLQDKLAEVRSKADEARLAKLRSERALLEGLAAAYDFALDAEDNAEEYLKIVEAQGLKIQLRAPMKPVVKLAFDGMCDEATIARLEAVLAWALKQDLPRGSLAERIEAEGGLEPILNGMARAA